MRVYVLYVYICIIIIPYMKFYMAALAYAFNTLRTVHRAKNYTAPHTPHKISKGTYRSQRHKRAESGGRKSERKRQKNACFFSLFSAFFSLFSPFFPLRPIWGHESDEDARFPCAPPQHPGAPLARLRLVAGARLRAQTPSDVAGFFPRFTARDKNGTQRRRTKERKFRQ